MAGRPWQAVLVSSSEPRLNPSSNESTMAAHQLTGDPVTRPKSTVSLTTHILLVGTMLLFFLVATLVTLQVTWQWWVIPAAVAIPVVAVLAERTIRTQKARESRRALAAGLRSGGTSGTAPAASDGRR